MELLYSRSVDLLRLQHCGLLDRLRATMKNWRKKFAMLVLLLLPLQALATALSAFTCHSGAHHATTGSPDRDSGTSHASHSHDGVAAHQHDGGAAHEHDGDASADHSGHLNCHHVFSGMPMALSVHVPAELPAFESSLSLLYTLFVPERPQRPPRG